MRKTILFLLVGSLTVIFLLSGCLATITAFQYDTTRIIKKIENDTSSTPKIMACIQKNTNRITPYRLRPMLCFGLHSA